MVTPYTHCFYSPSQPTHVLDGATQDGKPQYGKNNLADYQKDYPDVQFITLKEATEKIRQYTIKPPQLTTAEHFDEMLNILPPVSWKSTAKGESFKMSERTNLDITCIFVRIGERYFFMENSIHLKHAEILDLVYASDIYQSQI